MIRIVVATSLLLVVLSCAHRDAGKGFFKLAGRTADTDSPHESGESDSTFYIGYVDYFPDTREFYTALYHQEGREYPDEDLLEARLDSVIVMDDDWGRERLPMKEAEKLLALSGLDTLSIYNRKHQLICRSPLARVEYLWNGLESYFIAVYPAADSFREQTEELYGITASHEGLLNPKFTATELQQEQLDRDVAEQLKINAAEDWKMRHYQTDPSGTIYSIISCWSLQSNEGASYLTALDGDHVTVLNSEVNNYHFLNILPVPIEIRGKPLLLVSAGYPSSDVLWDYLAAFDGTQYQALEDNRVHLREMPPAQDELMLP